jgi:hypothetical protein
MKIGMVSDSLGHLSFYAMLNTAAKLGIQGVSKSVELLQAVAPSETRNDKPQEFCLLTSSEPGPLIGVQKGPAVCDWREASGERLQSLPFLRIRCGF